MAIGTTAVGPQRSGKFWNDQRFRGLVAQAFVMGLIGLLLYFFVSNAIYNMEQRNIASGFRFLSQPSGFQIDFKLIPYSSASTYGRVFVVGLLNTLLISALGCLIATILGFTLGILRLSGNWLLEKIIYWYVEFTRNVPLVLQMYFWYAIFLRFPKVGQSIVINDTFYLNNRGLFSPMPIVQDGFSIVLGAGAIAIAGAWAISHWAKRRQEATGQVFPAFWVNLALIVGLPVLMYFAMGSPLELEHPTRTRFNLTGGLVIRPEFMAVLTALSLYTAAFISEIVRAGILSVNKGQREAAASLGLKPNRVMRLIIVPQALRVIVPPLASQYMNLTKNSSLGFAIGYAELMAVFGGISLNQTGQAIECMAITMAAYLVISLSISAFMNWYNSRVRLVER